MKYNDIANISNGKFNKRISETETSACCADAAPENPRKIIDIGYNGEEDQLKESGHFGQMGFDGYFKENDTVSYVLDSFYAGDIDQDEAVALLVNKFEFTPSEAIKELTGEDDPLNKVLESGLKNEGQSINERIQKRKEFNKHLKEAIDSGKLEEIVDEKKPLGRCRYQLQKWVNGGAPYIDEEGIAKTDGKKGEPTQYEAWRAEMNDKKRIARLEQERDDRNSSFHSPVITVQEPEKTLDSQLDEYLAWYVDKYGNS